MKDLSTPKSDQSNEFSLGTGGWFTKPEDSSSSGGIEFEDSDGTVRSSSSEDDSSEKGEDAVDAPKSSAPSIQCMYIQMEYCEKSTLRTVIDSELFHDKVRIWRLFREIVEGLAYIHQQGIIHRDLKVFLCLKCHRLFLYYLNAYFTNYVKPVNIFLDSDDHVKIGDFGLATSRPLTSLTTGAVDALDGTPRATPREKSSDVVSSSGQLTGEIGTALYVAPELKTGGFSFSPVLIMRRF